MRTEGLADRISLLKLVEHVGRAVGPRLAAHAVRERWAAEEVRFWVDWLIKDPRSAVKHRCEVAPFDFIAKLEARGWDFSKIIQCSESGIYFEFQNFAVLSASRADAARFWPLEEKTSKQMAPGRKSPVGAPPAYDWEAALIHCALYMHRNGLPKRKATLIRHALEFFGEDEPSETQVKEHIGPLYDAFQAAASEKARNSRK
jgi:hypothetical protein